MKGDFAKRSGVTPGFSSTQWTADSQEPSGLTPYSGKLTGCRAGPFQREGHQFATGSAARSLTVNLLPLSS